MKIHSLKSSCLTAITFLLASATIAADLKIGTVDVARAYSEYYKTKDADARLQETAAKAKDGMQKHFASLKKLHDDAQALSKESNDAGLEAQVRIQKRTQVQSKLNEIRSLDEDIKIFRQRQSDQLKEENTQQRKDLHDDILKVITEQSKVAGYDLVLDKSGSAASLMPFPLHAKEGVATTDFTSEVIAALNKNAPTAASPTKSERAPEKKAPEKKSADEKSERPGNADGRQAPRRPDAKDTYTITSTLELAKPFNLQDMTDDFQEARLISQTEDSCVVEITYYPLFRPEIGENRNWREDYAGMTEYLRPRPNANWDEKMRADLLAELRTAGIDPERLTDKELVEQVSKWAIRRTRSTSAFAIWTFHYPDGKPEVFPALRSAYEHIRSKEGKTEQQMVDEEVLGRSMYYGKVRGSCTSSSIYLSTIFRALGIPTRIVFCAPPFDPNDRKQAEMFYNAVHHHHVRETVRQALDGMTGFDNHQFNEVFVGNRWVRLNYSTLGQPILDSRYFGLLTHILTSSDMSDVPLAATWGMRFFRYDEAQPRLSSVNPYRLIAVTDRFGENARLQNPEVALAELQTVTINGLIRPGDKRVPESLARGWHPNSRNNFLISTKEWVPGTYRQMRAFNQRASRDFLLVAPGHADVRVRLTGLNMSKGDGSFQVYETGMMPEDQPKLVRGVGYTIKPINTSETYRWQASEDLGTIVFED
jgi:outer membrane protein